MRDLDAVEVDLGQRLGFDGLGHLRLSAGGAKWSTGLEMSEDSGRRRGRVVIDDETATPRHRLTSVNCTLRATVHLRGTYGS